MVVTNVRSQSQFSLLHLQGWKNHWDKWYDLNDEMEMRYIAVRAVLTEEQGKIVINEPGFQCTRHCNKYECVPGCRGARKQAGSKSNSVLGMLTGET